MLIFPWVTNMHPFISIFPQCVKIGFQAVGYPSAIYQVHKAFFSCGSIFASEIGFNAGNRSKNGS